MATCQNGWPAIPTGTDSRLVAIPRIIGRVRKGAVAVIFDHLTNFFDTHIENIDGSRDEWGYAYRPVRGQTTGLSNHAGYAIDINAMRHPRRVYGTFSAAQKKKMNAYLKNTLEGVVRWGENYPRPYVVDGMHFEIVGTPAQVARVAAKLSAPAVIAPAAKPKPSAPAKAPAKAPDKAPAKAYPAVALIVDGGLGPVTVRALQSLLSVTKDYKGKISGKLDKATWKGVQAWLKRIGRYTGRIDGKPGPMTGEALQGLLSARAGYKGYRDGKIQRLTVEALQRYLNGQRRYL